MSEMKKKPAGYLALKQRSGRINKFGNCPLCGKQVKPTKWLGSSKTRT